jgi:predicted ATPase
MASFSELCDQIVQSDSFDKQRRRQIAGALETDAKLLAKVIPNLSSLIGERSTRFGGKTEASFPKFRAACKAFIHTVASSAHPIVIFLDDVQWADKGSIQLIQMFLQDTELANVMFIVACRDEKSEHVLESILENVRDTTTMIALTN